MYRNFIFLVSSLLLIASSSFLASARELSPAATVFQNAKDSLVTVIGGGHGSGFLISNGGLILTNSHVVSGSSFISVRFDEDHTVDADLLVNDLKSDIAILRVNLENIEKYQVIHLSKNDPLVVVGEKVIALGTPINFETNERTMTLGVVGKYMDGVIHHDANINGGNSGGPLINYDGEVVGINTFTISDHGSGLAGAVAISKAYPSLKEAISIAKTKDKPPAELHKVARKIDYPYREVSFKNLRKEPKPKDYIVNNKYFRAVIATPLVLYREIARHDERRLKERKKRADDKGFEVAAEEYEANKITNYEESFLSITKPVVSVFVIPRPKLTPGGVFKKTLAESVAISAAVFSGVYLPIGSAVGNKRRVKEDFEDLKLVNESNQEVCKPLSKYRFDATEQFINLFALTQNYHVEDKIFVGKYEFDPLCFETDEKLALSITSEGGDKPRLIKIKSKLQERVNNDFVPYWKVAPRTKI